MSTTALNYINKLTLEQYRYKLKWNLISSFASCTILAYLTYLCHYYKQTLFNKPKQLEGLFFNYGFFICFSFIFILTNILIYRNFKIYQNMQHNKQNIQENIVSSIENNVNKFEINTRLIYMINKYNQSTDAKSANQSILYHILNNQKNLLNNENKYIVQDLPPYSKANFKQLKKITEDTLNQEFEIINLKENISNNLTKSIRDVLLSNAPEDLKNSYNHLFIQIEKYHILEKIIIELEKNKENIEKESQERKILLDSIDQIKIEITNHPFYKENIEQIFSIHNKISEDLETIQNEKIKNMIINLNKSQDCLSNTLNELSLNVENLTNQKICIIKKIINYTNNNTFNTLESIQEINEEEPQNTI